MPTDLAPTADALAVMHTTFTSLVPIPDAEWKRIAGEMRLRKLAKGDLLTRVGDRDILGAVVIKGLMRAFYLSANGDEYIKSFTAEGGIVASYGSAIRREPSNMTIEALEDTEALIIPWPAYEALYDRHVCWQAVGRRIAELYYSIRERHTYQLLTMNGGERYDAFRRQFPHLVGRVPQKHVAAYLGLNAASLNRIVRARHKQKKK